MSQIMFNIQSNSEQNDLVEQQEEEQNIAKLNLVALELRSINISG